MSEYSSESLGMKETFFGVEFNVTFVKTLGSTDIPNKLMCGELPRRQYCSQKSPCVQTVVLFQTSLLPWTDGRMSFEGRKRRIRRLEFTSQ